jgi:14-3-3 protein epsilon
MKGKDFKKEDYVLLAKLAQQTERFEEMVTFADQILLSQEELVPAERNLCASAYKSLVASRRAELKVI